MTTACVSLTKKVKIDDDDDDDDDNLTACVQIKRNPRDDKNDQIMMVLVMAGMSMIIMTKTANASLMREVTSDAMMRWWWQ